MNFNKFLEHGRSRMFQVKQNALIRKFRKKKITEPTSKSGFSITDITHAYLLQSKGGDG